MHLPRLLNHGLELYQTKYKMQKIVISILNFNSTKETIECLESLLKVNFEGIEVSTIVRDNGSNEKFKIDSSKYKKINLEIDFGKLNLGFSGGHNVIIKKALKGEADFVLILNNDVILDRDFLVKLLVIAQSSSKIGVVVPKIYFEKGYEFHKDKYKDSELGKVIWYAGGEMDWANLIGFHRGVDHVDLSQFDEVVETPFPTGACMLVSRKVIDSVGIFDERYFLYYEDSDWAMRIKRADFKIIYAPESRIWHKNAASSGSGSPLHDYYITRNRMLFGMKYASLKTKSALVRESVKTFISGRKWQRIGIRDYYLKKFGKGSYS